MTTKQTNIAFMSEADAYATLREVPQISEEAAKSMAQAIALKPEVATKTDVAEVRTEMAELKSEIKVEMAQMESRTAQMESRLLRWFVSITVFGWGVMIAAMSLIIR